MNMGKSCYRDQKRTRKYSSFMEDINIHQAPLSTKWLFLNFHSFPISFQIGVTKIDNEIKRFELKFETNEVMLLESQILVINFISFESFVYFEILVSFGYFESFEYFVSIENVLSLILHLICWKLSKPETPISLIQPNKKVSGMKYNFKNILKKIDICQKNFAFSRDKHALTNFMTSQFEYLIGFLGGNYLLFDSYRVWKWWIMKNSPINLWKLCTTWK